MKRIIIVVAISFVSLKTFATPGPTEKLDEYKAAVAIALQQKPLVCTLSPADEKFSDGGLAEYINKYMNSADVSGATINFSGVDQLNNREVAVVTLTTDHKSIVSVEINQSSSTEEQINVGTIDNPKIITQMVWTTSVSGICK